MRKILSGLMFVLVVCWGPVAFAQLVDDELVNVGPRGIATVSYTHLTLPTNREV